MPSLFSSFNCLDKRLLFFLILTKFSFTKAFSITPMLSFSSPLRSYSSALPSRSSPKSYLTTINKQPRQKQKELHYSPHNSPFSANNNYINSPPQLPTTITKPETAPSAEADLAFKRAIYYEKSGQVRSAHAHYHEAATLWQCFLDTTTINEKEEGKEKDFAIRDAFSHVTSCYNNNPITTAAATSLDYDSTTTVKHTNNDNSSNKNKNNNNNSHNDLSFIESVLSYTCSRLAHLSGDALADDWASLILYGDAVRIDPERRLYDSSSFFSSSCSAAGNEEKNDNDNNKEEEEDHKDKLNKTIQVMIRHATYYDGMGTAIEAAACGSFSKAIEAYRRGLSLLERASQLANSQQQKHELNEEGGGNNRNVVFDDGGVGKTLSFHLAIALERMGGDENTNEATRIFDTFRNNDDTFPSSSSSSSTTHTTATTATTSPSSTTTATRSDSSHLIDSWGYVRWHTRRVPPSELNLYLGTRSLLQIGIEAAMPLIEQTDGLVCEFGVASGRSLRMIQETLPLDVPLHGFDAFGNYNGARVGGGQVEMGTETGGFGGVGGAPRNHWFRDGDEMPTNIAGEVYVHRGLFVDTIPEFLKAKQNKKKNDGDGENGDEEEEEEDLEYYQPLAFANIDCDLYSSALSILEQMHSRVVPGTVLCFDEYLGHPTWRKDEFRAWRECCKRFGWSYEYLGFSFRTNQAVVRVTTA